MAPLYRRDGGVIADALFRYLVQRASIIAVGAYDEESYVI
jgi:hypothetical protein